MTENVTPPNAPVVDAIMAPVGGCSETCDVPCLVHTKASHCDACGAPGSDLVPACICKSCRDALSTLLEERWDEADEAGLDAAVARLDAKMVQSGVIRQASVQQGRADG